MDTFTFEKTLTVDLLIEHLQDFKDRGLGDTVVVWNDDMPINKVELKKGETQELIIDGGQEFYHYEDIRYINLHFSM